MPDFAFIDELYFPRETRYVRMLLTDEDKKLIIEQIGKKLMESPNLVSGNLLDKLVCILSMAKFDFDEEEPVAIGAIIVNYTTRGDLPVRLMDYNEKFERLSHLGEDVVNRLRKDLGSNCLVSLAFLQKYMERRYEHHGAPQPGYYRETGIEAFRRCGMTAIADNFRNWEEHIRQNIAWTFN